MATVASAQHADVVTDADLRRAQRAQPVITDGDIENARRRHGGPLPEVPAPVGRSAPSIDALPKPLAPALDLNAVAEGFRVAGGTARRPTDGVALLVFVSLSMPEPSLRRLADQASRAGASLLVRGLHGGSLAATAQAVQRIGAGRSVPVRIDPQAFDRHDIGAVPTFVLTGSSVPPSCQGPACPAAMSLSKASGDVSLDHALRQMARSSLESARAAEPFLRRLEPR